MQNNKLDCKYCIFQHYWDKTKTEIQCNNCNNFSNFKENVTIKTPLDNKNYVPTIQLSMDEINYPKDYKDKKKSLGDGKYD